MAYEEDSNEGAAATQIDEVAADGLENSNALREKL